MRPQDSAVLFAEDAVRSAAARELVRCESAEVFHVLLDAALQRATGGLVIALGEFHRPKSVPLLFEILEDDLCREDAKESLRKMPNDTRQFGILAIRGLTGVTLDGPSARCRRRATLQLMSELGVAKGDWPDVRRFLWESDPGTQNRMARDHDRFARNCRETRLCPGGRHRTTAGRASRHCARDCAASSEA
jgi:hypothetical protein